MPLEPIKHVNGRMWQPGQSGNPNGRPAGSRTVFSQAFLKDLAEVWSEEGRETMVKTARTSPATFFAVCARLIGPEVKLTIEQTLPGNLSMEDWQTMKEVIAAVRQATPDAASRPPRAVLDHVLSALKQAQAKTIDCSGSMDSWNWRPGLLGPDSQVVHGARDKVAFVCRRREDRNGSRSAYKCSVIDFRCNTTTEPATKRIRVQRLLAQIRRICPNRGCSIGPSETLKPRLHSPCLSALLRFGGAVSIPGSPRPAFCVFSRSAIARR